MERLICLLIGYVFGMFQTAFIIGKIKHIDIREHGSGNAGTTNALRTLGFKAGLMVFVGDCFKAVVAALVVRLIFTGGHPEDITVLVLYTGLGVILGHNFPFYLKFKGGKGIAATAGVVLSLACWQLILIGLALFIFAVAVSKYISTGSLVMVVTVFTTFVVLDYLGIMKGVQTPAASYEAAIVMFLFVVFAFIRHKENIVRLVKGTERELTFKKKS